MRGRVVRIFLDRGLVFGDGILGIAVFLENDCLVEVALRTRGNYDLLRRGDGLPNCARWFAPPVALGATLRRALIPRAFRRCRLLLRLSNPLPEAARRCQRTSYRRNHVAHMHRKPISDAFRYLLQPVWHGQRLSRQCRVHGSQRVGQYRNHRGILAQLARIDLVQRVSGRMVIIKILAFVLYGTEGRHSGDTAAE